MRIEPEVFDFDEIRGKSRRYSLNCDARESNISIQRRRQGEAEQNTVPFMNRMNIQHMSEEKKKGRVSTWDT